MEEHTFCLGKRNPMLFRLYFSCFLFVWTLSINYNEKIDIAGGLQANIIYLFTMLNVQCSMFTNHQQSMGKISKEFTFILISSMHLISKTTFSLRCRCRCVVAVASFHFLVDRIENSFMARDFKSHDMTVLRTMKIQNHFFSFFFSEPFKIHKNGEWRSSKPNIESSNDSLRFDSATP